MNNKYSNKVMDNIQTKSKTITHQQANQLNIYSGYTYQQGLQREILCMKLLYNAYQKYGCTCGCNVPHFPLMIANKIDKNRGGYIKMTYQGYDLQKIKLSCNLKR